MAIRNYKPTTNGRRKMSSLINEEITTDTPEKSLLVTLTKKGGRNNQGKITVRHHGGGAKRKYRLIDFKDTEFVLARDMKLNKNSNETFVVGFLCDFEGAKNYKDNEWVEIIGEVTKDKYHNEDIPLIKILKMKKTSKPNEDKLFVPGPDNTYIPTSAMF